MKRLAHFFFSGIPDEKDAPAPLTTNPDGSINIPSDGSQYTPRIGDMICCDDGANYAIIDVSQYDKEVSASSFPDISESLFQLDMPEAEIIHFIDGSGDYLFVKNLYETLIILSVLCDIAGAGLSDTYI